MFAYVVSLHVFSTFLFFLQSNLIDSQSSSPSPLTTSEDEYAEENMLDSSSASSDQDQGFRQGNWEVVLHHIGFAPCTIGNFSLPE